ncbi:iron ABC transporter permease [Lutibacter sp. B2]|nr:iron ABC transporter permease [Lutibacter sp. B2]
MREHFTKELNKKYNMAKMVGIMLGVILIILLFVSTNLGRADISIMDTIRVIFGKIIHNPDYYMGMKKAYVNIIWEIRLPRILIAIIVGSGLAVSGAVFQSLLMNPLADSYTMGVSSGAAFGATLAIYINLFAENFYAPITLFAFIGAFVTLLLVIYIAKVNGYLSSSNLIIAGIIVSSILSAAIKLLKNFAGENVSAIVNWLMGSLASRSWSHVYVSFPIIIVCVLVCWYYSQDLNLLCLGENEARALGVDTQKIRRIFLICGSLITAVCVAVSGVIGFIGLIVPHILRFSIGSDNRSLVPLSGILGALLLLLADTGARSLMNVEIPVGVLTTLLGGPFFIYIFVKKNKTL